MFLHLSVILFTGGGLCLRGSLSKRVLVQGGLCQGDPHPHGNVGAVRILLECILVSMNNFTFKNRWLFQTNRFQF